MRAENSDSQTRKRVYKTSWPSTSAPSTGERPGNCEESGLGEANAETKLEKTKTRTRKRKAVSLESKGLLLPVRERGQLHAPPAAVHGDEQARDRVDGPPRPLAPQHPVHGVPGAVTLLLDVLDAEHVEAPQARPHLTRRARAAWERTRVPGWTLPPMRRWTVRAESRPVASLYQRTIATMSPPGHAGRILLRRGL